MQFFETVVALWQLIQCNISEDISLQQHHCDYLISCIEHLFFSCICVLMVNLILKCEVFSLFATNSNLNECNQVVCISVT